MGPAGAQQVTLLSGRADVAPVADANPDSSPSGEQVSRRDLGWIRRVIVLVAVGVACLLLTYGFFNAFVTQLWYQSRQRSMATLLSSSGGSALNPRPGDLAGVLQVRTPFTLNLEITEGDVPEQLRGGPGHRPGTPLPGTLGNSIVYGRAKQWGDRSGRCGTSSPVPTSPWNLSAGSSAPVLDYKVTAVHVVSAGASVRYMGRSDDYRLTLVTNAGGAFSDQRLVVVAVSGTEAGRASPAHMSPGPRVPSFLNRTLLEMLGWLAAAALVVALATQAPLPCRRDRRYHPSRARRPGVRVPGALPPLEPARLNPGRRHLYRR